ncbi:hypothetical protein ACRAWF_32870 [Streptomyces sp. L7]
MDVTSALPQMARYSEVDYLVLDYLMEHGLAKMAAAQEGRSRRRLRRRLPGTGRPGRSWGG